MLELIKQVIQESTDIEEDIDEGMMLVDDLGLSSIDVMVLLGDLEKALGKKIPVSAIRNVETVGDLCQVIEEL